MPHAPCRSSRWLSSVETSAASRSTFFLPENYSAGWFRQGSTTVGPGGLLTYSPSDVTIARGDSVTFTWDSDLHTVTYSAGPISWIDSGLHNVADPPNPFTFVLPNGSSTTVPSSLKATMLCRRLAMTNSASSCQRLEVGCSMLSLRVLRGVGRRRCCSRSTAPRRH